MKVIAFEDLSKTDWDALIEKSVDGWLYQTSQYLAYNIAQGKVSVSFGVVTDSNELMAVVPAFLEERSLEEDPIRLTSVEKNRQKLMSVLERIQRKLIKVMRLRRQVFKFTAKSAKKPCFQINLGYSGYAVSSKVGEKGRKKILRFVFSHLDQLAERHGAEELVVRRINPFDGDPAKRKFYNDDWFFGINVPFQTVPRLTVILDLRKEESELWKGLDEDNRNIIKQAEKKGVIFRIGDVSKDLVEYHNIHVESWDRTMNHHQPLDMYESMVEKLGTQSVRLFFADEGNAAASAVLLHVYKKGVFYWGGCSRTNALKIGSNNFLLWHSILWAKAEGCGFFEIGIFDSYQFGNGKEYTVGQYKKQFSNSYFMENEARKYYSTRPLISDHKQYLREFSHNAREKNKAVE